MAKCSCATHNGGPCYNCLNNAHQICLARRKCDLARRESTIEKYLHACVRANGGTTYKFVSPQHNNVPDRIVIWPGDWISVRRITRFAPNIQFVETKAPKKGPRPGQLREHTRLRALGCTVEVLSTKEQVDQYVERNR